MSEHDLSQANVAYTAYFVDDIPSVHSTFPHRLSEEDDVTLFGHHTTIEYRPGSGINNIEIGRKVTLRAIGRVTSFEAGVDVLLVDDTNISSTNDHPHITLATRKGVKPVTSNAAIAHAEQNGAIEHFDVAHDISATEGYYDGTMPIVTPN